MLRSASIWRSVVKWWRVEVTDHDGQIVAIEPQMLAGRDIGERERETIEHAISNLVGFIGGERQPECICTKCGLRHGGGLDPQPGDPPF